MKANPPAPRRPARRRWLRDRPIRTKLVMILALPVVAMVGLTGLSVVSAAGRAADAEQARELVALGGTSARLTVQLQRERAAAALVFAESSSPGSLADYRRQAGATDAVVTVFRAELARTRLTGSLEPLMSRVDVDLAGLAALRQQVSAAPEPWHTTEPHSWQVAGGQSWVWARPQNRHCGQG